MEHVKNYVKGLALVAIMTLALSAITFAQASSNTASVQKGLACLCGQVIELMPIICMLLVMAAGVVYAAGQVAGAETRARAAGYATAMILGAVIGIIMTLILPPVVAVMYPNNTGFSCVSSGNC